VAESRGCCLGMVTLIGYLGLRDGQPEEAVPVTMDPFGKADPKEMPLYFFRDVLYLDYATAVRAETTAQDYTGVPRHWYIDATLQCTACGSEFVWPAEQQRVWFETYRLDVLSQVTRCRDCSAPPPDSASTTIAGRDVPIEPGDPTLVWFSPENPDDAMSGLWEFWTLFNESRSVTGRCRQGSDPGERFRRMEGLEDYEDAWEIALAATGIRPATRKAVTGWLNSHAESARFAESCKVGPAMLRVVQAEEGCQLEERG
jgi:hypothetical protein